MIPSLIHRSLRWRLILLIASSIIFPMLSTLLLATYQAGQILQKEAKQHLRQENTALANNVNQWDQNVVKILENISQQPGILAMDAAAQKAILDASSRVYEDIYLINTINLNGMNIARSDEADLTDYSDRTYFQQAILGEPITREIVLGRTSAKPAVVFATGIINDITQETLGVLALAIKLTDVTEKVQAVTLGQTGFAFVVDERGKILAHPNIETVYSLQDFRDYPPVKALLEGNSGFFMFEDENNIQWFAHTVVLPNHWGVIVQQQQREILERVYRFWTFALFLTLIILILVILITWQIANHIIDPLQRLSQAFAKTGQGDLNQIILTNRKDEVGILSQEFNEMAQQLKDLFNTLEDKVASRTEKLSQANAEIILLNQKLSDENLRMGAELVMLEKMQRMVLPNPEELSAIDGLDIAAHMQPASEVGGDYYDILRSPSGVAFCIGDVTGHGLESGLLMVMTQVTVRTLINLGLICPYDFFIRLNETIFQNIERIKSDKNLTFALVIYQENKLIISGQHEEVIICRNNGEIERVDTIDLGLPIGLTDDISSFLSYTVIHVQPGDTVILYTDGITEAMNPEEKLYGMDRLCAIISQHWNQPAEQIKNAILEDLRQFIGEQKIFDDITLVVFKC
ncbi:SpoIIE family protein phosphatase [Spirulina subsalsa FACHB-351]|uniref:SpoIIE family protein phosphatase n=1 Tax=Spirulina subsalsa FACHB-351 TaxID=234711 RepID=A0ABT3LCP0_9CYAN|nr:SpoIIE family protein phosphatase [Spirulina subsalsa]MCW6038874.1 SpoIIE family protein phosphatase [Spirulina subsalsa FACHB-351]